MNAIARLGLKLSSTMGLLSLLAIGCAAPAPGEDVDGSESGISTDGGGQNKLTAAGSSIEPVTNDVNESAVLSGPSLTGLVDVCHAYQNGTDEQKHACDNYPTGYHRMSCVGFNQPAVGPGPSGHGSVKAAHGVQCYSGNGFPDASYRPYDQGDGTYAVHFVNHADPTDRRTDTVSRYSDFLHLGLSGPDFVGTVTFPGGLLSNLSVVVPPSTTTTVKGLHLFVQVKKELNAQLLGCADAFSTAGLSPDEIAQKDAALVASCAQPSAPLEGRDGWTTLVAGASIFSNKDVNLFQYDATPLLAPNLHVLFAFAVNGHVQWYIFTT